MKEERRQKYEERRRNYIDYLDKIKGKKIEKCKNSKERRIYYIYENKLSNLGNKYRITFHKISTSYKLREHRPPSYSKFQRTHWRKWESISNNKFMIVQTKRTKRYKYYIKREKNEKEYWELCEIQNEHKEMYEDIKKESNNNKEGKKFCYIPDNI